MNKHEWVKEFPVAFDVCDKNGILLELNDKAINFFEKYGGEKLIGTNIIKCHDEPSKSKFKEMLKNPTVNCYTLESNGIKKLIYQASWYKDNVYMGYAEIILEIPFEMPHKIF
jgi:hypothetical protein